MSLVTLVALPYLRTKAERAYVARTGGEAARLGLVSAGDDDRQDSQARNEVSLPACTAPWVNNSPCIQTQGVLSRHAPQTVRGRLERLLVAGFPYMHWAAEMSAFATGCVWLRSWVLCYLLAPCPRSKRD